MLQKVSPSPPASSRASSSAGADSPPEPTAAELDALRDRDPDAIERWVYGNRRIVYRLLLKMVKDADVAEELLQETFYQALRSIDRFRGDSKVSTWLCSIARNLAFRYFRDQDRYTTAESDTLEWMNHNDESASSLTDGDPRDHTERTERKELVHAALAELPDSYREIIRMRDLEEKSTKEVAEALDLTRVNVRVRLHRARQKLEDLLRPQFEDDLRRTGRLAVAA
jgi:RNA polymerase sigma-70 factor (ECF subfamily)